MKKSILAVIDTNVLVSALLARNPGSATVLIMEKMLDKALTPVVNDEIIQEYTEVLLRPKFGFNPATVASFIETISELALNVDRTEYADELPDPKDRVFYEVSLTGDSYLVTGNLKHFPATPKVVSPSEMLAILFMSC